MPSAYRSLFLFALALGTGCSGDSSVTPETRQFVQTGGAQASRGGSSVVARPMGGRCVTEIEVLPANFPILLLHITGDCTLEHLGRVTLESTQSVNLISMTITNSSSYTAANGDVLRAPFTGVATFNPDGSVSFTGSEVYQGGTGRFSNASGSSALSGTATLSTGEYTTSGSIAY